MRVVKGQAWIHEVAVTTAERLFEGFTFKVADAGERDKALNLRRELYLEEFGDDGLDSLDDSAHHLVALNPQRNIIAALRIVDAAHRPFDLDHFVELPYLDPARIPAEVGRFCISKDYRQVRSDQFVHLGVFKLLYDFASVQGITDLFTLGTYELRSLYRFICFRETDIKCRHHIGNRVVQLMHLDLVALMADRGARPMARFLLNKGQS